MHYYQKEMVWSHIQDVTSEVWGRLGRKTPCPYNSRLVTRKLKKKEIQRIKTVYAQHNVDLNKWIWRMEKFRYSLLLISSLCTQRRN
jgi:hypothetical protein